MQAEALAYLEDPNVQIIIAEYIEDKFPIGTLQCIEPVIEIYDENPNDIIVEVSIEDHAKKVCIAFDVNYDIVSEMTIHKNVVNLI